MVRPRRPGYSNRRDSISAKRPAGDCCLSSEQAVEKYLKGFLLASGWNLRRIHDLEVLLQEAIARDADFAAFLPSCQRITEYYIETRYPMGFSTPLEPDTLKDDLKTLYTLILLIRSKVKP